MSSIKEYMNSDAGALTRYRQRKRRRVDIYIDEVEPQSKKMPGAERDKFQAAVAAALTLANRTEFRGNVALKLDLATTSKNAPQAHTIAKNLLDLLSERRSGVMWPRRHLLYKDDRQIQALFVSCRHGVSNPRIVIEARPFSAMLDDLELAAKAVRVAETSGGAWYDQDRDTEWIETFRDLKRNATDARGRLGDDMYDAYLKLTRWSAQRALLGRSGITIPVLSWMYGLPSSVPTVFSESTWTQLVGASPLRLQFGELPISTGGSEEFKQTITAEINAFKQRWDWLINPLVIAVALEVVVRPNPATPAAVLHDLDNIVRDYLLPAIVPSFGTVSDHRWTIDFNELKARDPKLSALWGPNPTPPSGTKRGVTRYEAWRLPAVEGKPGFVSVALVADMDARGDRLYEVDQSIRTLSGSRDV
jgi:hypothetical protein